MSGSIFESSDTWLSCQLSMPGLLLPRRFHESPIRLRLTVHEYAERETSEIVEDHSVYVLRGVGRPHKGLDADLLAEPIESGWR